MATELAPGVYRLRTDYVEVCGLPLALHVVVDGDHVTLLDTGVDSTTDSATVPELRAVGLDAHDLRMVVNSHAHPDHMGGNSSLARMTNASFAAPAAEAGWLEDNELLLDELWGANPEAYGLDASEQKDLLALLGERVRIDYLLRDGDAVPGGSGRLQVVTTSGHSPGHIAVFDRPSRILFSFDDVQGRGVPYADSDMWLAPLYGDVRRYRTGLRRLLELDFDALAPAHGEVLDGEAGRARVEASLEWTDDVDWLVRTLLRRRGSLSVREVAEVIGTELGAFGGVCLQTVQVARAHLDELTRDGLVAPRWHASEASGGR